jgi:hypothetical protein
LLTHRHALTNHIEPSDIDPDETETDDDDIIAQRLAGIEEQKRKRSRKE